MQIFFIILAVVAAWLGCFWAVTAVFDTWAIRGQFGDLFGSVNALFSGLAFAALIYTIFLQRRELELQRIELQLQREEMQKSRAELAEQAKVQKAQFLSSIARLKAEASAARIEAQKVDSESKTPGARGDYVRSINAEAERIDNLASGLEQLNEEG